MRIIVVLMLIANLAFFAWRQFYTEPPMQKVVQTPALPGNQINRLLLLTEFDESALRERIAASSTNSRASSESSAHSSEDAVCYSIGPLATEQQVTLIATWLKEKGAQTTLREAERREVSRFWVYFPPFESRAAALERVADMQADAIDDIYVIPAGDMANAVSLGLYSRKESLDRRITELKEKGYEPSIVPRYEIRSAAWFDVVAEDQNVFPSAQFAAAFPDTDATEHGCG